LQKNGQASLVRFFSPLFFAFIFRLSFFISTTSIFHGVSLRIDEWLAAIDALSCFANTVC
jgi:hypothetical protein